MITITLPDWIWYLIIFAITMKAINDVLGIYSWYLKRKIDKLKEGE